MWRLTLNRKLTSLSDLYFYMGFQEIKQGAEISHLKLDAEDTNRGATNGIPDGWTFPYGDTAIPLHEQEGAWSIYTVTNYGQCKFYAGGNPSVSSAFQT